ncbi:uncharacterized protein LOC132904045 [Amyelois transitella]|uniref:uncharacterized protein LOC132904045 n=1 Tax=Amyelois transitella TaxID=680683 RepID=UPI00298FFFBB|nr:uncharacterized protein LOC132904045 [Amyelois transitella]
MMRSPTKLDSYFGSAPNLNMENENTTPNASNITQRLKRKRCDCGGQFTEESKIDKFINTISLWRQETDSKLSDIKASMHDLLRQNSEILASQSETEKSIEFLSQKYDDLLQQLSSQQSQAQASLERVVKLEATTEEIDRRSRSSTLELRNIRLPNKTFSMDDLLITVTCIFKELAVNVTTSDIYDIYRLPPKSDSATIVCKLNSVLLKAKILQAFKDYNKRNANNRLNSTVVGGSQHPVYIGEHLTAQARRLFYLAREFAKAESYKYCWTSGGRVLLRKADNAKLVIVASESQLSGLHSKN